MKEKTHAEVITHIRESLSQMPTDSKFIHGLGDADHSRYDECWREFDRRYHDPIIAYILKKAGWPQGDKHKAEDILQLVYIKGFRWNFRRLEKGMFRRAVKQMVKDMLCDYFREMGRSDHPILRDGRDLERDCPGQCQGALDEIAAGETIAVAEEVLAGYPQGERQVLACLWENGSWPRSRDLSAMLGLATEEAARQWKHRNQNLWSEFQDKVKQSLGDSR